MRCLVSSNARFLRLPSASVWVPSVSDYGFWTRYLTSFSNIDILARVIDVDQVPDNALRVDGEGVHVIALPYYVGPMQYLMHRQKTIRLLQMHADEADAILLRAPSQAATVIASHLPVSRPFAVEVVGDPYEVLAPGAMRHPLRPFFRWRMTSDLERAVASASAVSYVTDSTLQARYPAAPGVIVTSYSSIDLSPEGYVAHPRAFHTRLKRTRVLFVGSLEQMYKGPDILLRALAQLLSVGHDAALRIVGDGRYRAELEQLTHDLGITRKVTFLGQLPSGAAIREQLNGTDVFVLPSRTEGLPRAMIEAMARGLPCIGTTVGGIPELLISDDMVPPGDVEALAAKLSEVISDPERMTAMSARNLELAQDYRSDVLRQRRSEFYQALKDQTQHWQETRPSL